MSLKNYIKELKRRNVFKAGIAYLVVSWLIIQVASIILPAFEAPPYILKVLLFILVIGFIVWLVFSWTYDVTEDGIMKTESIKTDNPNRKQTRNRLNKVIIIGLSIAVVLLLINQFYTNEKPIPEKTKLITSLLDSKKMAVLPFLNTKPDTNTDYLGFALADQIIGGLVYVNAINIRPSSSIRKYENITVNPSNIGKELDVEFLLHGNFLMEGDDIRLNIELINTNTNSIIFREPLQLNFESVFELQDIVSKKIIEKLKVHFAPNEQNRIKKNIPTNTLAYEYYLRAISYSGGIKNNELAIEMLQKALEIDSTFAPSYSALGRRTHNLANYGLQGQEATKKAEKYYKKALSLNDELLSAYNGLSTIYTETGRTKMTVETIKKVLEINPNDSEAHRSLGYIYRYTGMLDESISAMKKARLLNNNTNTTIGMCYIAAGKYDEAYEAIESQKDGKENSLDLGFQGIIRYRQGRNDEAMDMFKQIHLIDPNSLNDLWVTAFVSLIEGNTEKGLVAARKFEEYNISDSEAWFHIGVNYALLGDKKSSIRCLNRAVNGGYFNYPHFLNEPFLDSLRKEKGFKDLLKLTEKKHRDFKKENF